MNPNSGNKTKSDIFSWNIFKFDTISFNRILKYFNDFQNRNFSVLRLKWTQTVEMKQNQTFFHGSFQIWCHIFFLLKYIKEFQWLYIIIMSRTSFRVNLHSVVCLNIKELLAQRRSHIWSLSDNNEIRTLNHLARKRTLSGCGFESRCCHLNFRYGTWVEQGFPWHSGKLQNVDSLWNSNVTW